VAQYRSYLDRYPVPAEERASVAYRIGGIYFDRLHDYENALAEYLRIRTLYPESRVASEVDKKIVACLERLERPEDARQALSESADLEPAGERRPGEVVAVLGEREITQGDLDFEIGRLPPEIQAQYRSPDKKLEFLHRYLATELMYDSARRAGLDRDREVLAGIFQAKKSLMVQKLLLQRIQDGIRIEEKDVELYYRANLKKYAETDDGGGIVRQIPFTEARQQAAQDLLQERQRQAYDELMASLLRADGVRIYDDRIK